MPEACKACHSSGVTPSGRLMGNLAKSSSSFSRTLAKVVAPVLTDSAANVSSTGNSAFVRLAASTAWRKSSSARRSVSSGT
ncbi:hypothetical protein G6F46_015288 [Rhizopus delemar]|nr:hypothetical protein G6F63_015631 [Rhizopus arrhizus]KAG1581982.1 hypothetical protein G6F46_015288 [Rhizopus delemar]